MTDYSLKETLNHMTREEQLKSLTTEKLAEVLFYIEDLKLWCNSKPDEVCNGNHCMECILNWLRQEVK